MRSVFTLFIAIFAAVVSAQESHNDYERYYAYFPDIEYTAFGFHSPRELAAFRLAQEFPDEIGGERYGLLWPFSTSEYDSVYTGTVRDERLSAAALAYSNKLQMDRRAQGLSTVLTMEERRELMVRFSPRLTTSIAVFSSADLQLLLESAVKSGGLQTTGERNGKSPVFAGSPVGAPATIRIFYLAPEPDLLLAAGTPELLKAMARAGDGSGPGLLNGEYGGDIKDYISDAPSWYVQPLNMTVNRVAEKEREQDMPERYRTQREEQIKGMPLFMITETAVTEEEIFSRQEWVFTAEEHAVKQMNQMKQIEQGITFYAQTDVPAAVTAHQRTRDASTKHRVEGKRYIREQVRTIEDLEAYRQLQSTYREYFGKREQEMKRRTYGEQKEQQ